MTPFTPATFTFPRPRGRPRLPVRLCAIAGCGERAYADNDYCQTHQRRVVRYGSPDVVKARGKKASDA